MDSRMSLRVAIVGPVYPFRAGIAYCTTVPGARATVAAIADLARGELEVAPLQAYF